MTYSTLPPTERVINRVGFSVVYCVCQLYILNLKQSKIQNKLDGWGALHSEDMVIGLEIFHNRLFLCQNVLNTLVMHMITIKRVFEAL